MDLQDFYGGEAKQFNSLINPQDGITYISEHYPLLIGEIANSKGKENTDIHEFDKNGNIILSDKNSTTSSQGFSDKGIEDNSLDLFGGFDNCPSNTHSESGDR